LIINRDSAKDDPAKTFILPVFLRPGRHDFFIFFQGEIYYNRHLIGVLKEEIPAFTKELKKTGKPRGFILQNSVFKARETDTEATAKAVLENDHIDKRIYDLLLENFHLLHDIFLSLAAQSNFPDVSLKYFELFCQEIGLFDNTEDFNTTLL
jgi:hypothetical protein